MPGGRPPKPIATLKAQGTERKHRHSKRAKEPKSGGKVTMPRSLKGDAARWWKSNVPRLESMGVLDGIDTDALVAAAKAWSNWCREQRLYEAGENRVINVGNAWNTYDKLASRFGMTPVDRVKLATKEEEAEDDPFAEWLKAKRESLN